jgi:hypothetical protein
MIAPASGPCRTLALVAIMSSRPPNWLSVWRIAAQLGLILVNDAKKLQFQMNECVLAEGHRDCLQRRIKT